LIDLQLFYQFRNQWKVLPVISVLAWKTRELRAVTSHHFLGTDPEGLAGTVGFFVEADGRPALRYLIPVAKGVGERIQMHLRDLGLKPGSKATLEVSAVDGAGNIGKAASGRIHTMTLTNREYRVIRIVYTERIVMGWMVILGLQARWLLGRIATLDSLPAAPAWALRVAPVGRPRAALAGTPREVPSNSPQVAR
jgi:hypothetical protein